MIEEYIDTTRSSRNTLTGSERHYWTLLFVQARENAHRRLGNHRQLLPSFSFVLSLFRSLFFVVSFPRLNQTNNYREFELRALSTFCRENKRVVTIEHQMLKKKREREKKRERMKRRTIWIDTLLLFDGAAMHFFPVADSRFSHFIILRRARREC